MNNTRISTSTSPSRLLDSFMDEFFRAGPFSGLNTVFSGNVDIDMYETENDVTVKVKAAGYKEDDIKVSVENNNLTIEGKARDEKEEKENRKYHIREMQEESFVRSIQLPTRVDAEKANANFENGVLTISMPKLEEAKPKTINIKTTNK
jgi:HSP20 family protein